MFEGENKAYRKVLEHRQNCPKWGEEFCLECFGGGLTKFIKDYNNSKEKEELFPNYKQLMFGRFMKECLRNSEEAIKKGWLLDPDNKK